MVEKSSGGLQRPDVSLRDAEAIARECYGIDGSATELGSNQDRNFLISGPERRFVLRIDNPVFTDAERDAQHAAIDAYRAADVRVARVLPGLDGALTQRSHGFAARLSEFAAGEPLVDAGYLAPVVLREFGTLAARSVEALADLTHPGLDRDHMWVLRNAHREVHRLASSISDVRLRDRVLAAADRAQGTLATVADALPVQAIHGDLTDDNVMARWGSDTRLHPETVLDLGDMAYGWRVGELAVTASSLLHHEPERPLRVLETVEAFHARIPLTPDEATALWPLIVLRGAILVASGWRQLEIDGANAYARERIAGEQRIFEASTAFPLPEMIEQVRERIGIPMASTPSYVTDETVRVANEGAPLNRLLVEPVGPVEMIDLGVESSLLDRGAWLERDAEQSLLSEALERDAVAVLPYGQYRLTRTIINTAEPAPTWSAATEVWLPEGATFTITAPCEGVLTRVSTDEPDAAGGGTITIDTGDGWEFVLGGIFEDSDLPELGRPSERERPVEAAAGRVDGAVVAAGTPIGLVHGAQPLVGRERGAPLTVMIRRRGAAIAPTSGGRSPLALPARVPAWARLTADPAALLGLPSVAQRDESTAEQARREQIFARAQERYYKEPMQVERGWRHHLVDTTGIAYVDMVNNVTGLGHGHAGIADAASRQIRLLNTNSRFLYRDLAEYSERLLALLPETEGGDGEPLDTVLLVNSGSEAVDLAIRLAQAATGRETVVALREAYHGWTMASDAVTTSAFDNPSALATRPAWVHVADVPNRFRGTYRGVEDDTTVAERYLDDLAADIRELEADGRPVAGFICESVLGNAGGVMLPKGYLTGAYERIRAAGGLVIADEIQVGFGRMGSSFWGFEQSGVYPDIVTIAKPMGNGFPIGGVITSQRIADSLADQGQFFSSAGGNPLSCRIGLAVLDAMAEEELQANASRMGARLRGGFAALAEQHEIIGPIHGEGLYLGVELVRDRVSLEPAAEEAAAICERLKELGVVVLTTSERSNVLKVKPPLCLDEASVDFVIAALDRVLTDGW